jgi:hypothetical protein
MSQNAASQQQGDIMQRRTLSLAIALACTGVAAAEYSPPVGNTLPSRVYFGDTHLHSSYSTDAGMVGNRLTPEDAFRFARGEQVTASMGMKAKLARPLDFLVVSDHAENLGLAPALASADPELLAHPFGKQLFELIRKGDFGGAFGLWAGTVNRRQDQLAGSGLQRSYWQRATAAADKYNDPGRFTAFIGYEWTAMPSGNNLHRNVIFRDGKDKADQIVPMSAFDSEDPEALWQWMDDYEKRTGGKLLAIPHNGNLSNGLMFDDVTLTGKQALSRDYAQQRARWEPIYEVTQMKGDGEAHPALSPSDEFANFERWDKGSLQGIDAKTPGMLPKEYAREALKRGLAYEQKLGVNPFKFGMIGSTDSHTSLSTSEEGNFFGKVSLLEPSAKSLRFDEPITGRAPNPEGKDIKQYAWQTSASGLAAVWARENTREALWDAMAKKEVYATTGTRLEVRLFAGDFTPADLTRADWVANGYAKGVPMGGDFKPAQVGAGGTAKSAAPAFLVKAARAPDGANLDRIQIVKGWLDASGKPEEKIYDIAWSGKRKPGKNGKLPPVGNTVDVKNATYSNSIGAATLEAYWKDPGFKASERAMYYVRVLEIPTPRWTVYDAKVFGTTPPKAAPTAIQDRAYTSPIWYSPS